jgi:hypothetical protein
MVFCLTFYDAAFAETSQETGKISYSMTKVFYSDEFRTLSYDFSSGDQFYQTIDEADSETQNSEVVSISIPESFETTGDEIASLDFQWNCKSGDFNLNTEENKLEVSLMEPSQTDVDNFDIHSWGGLEYTSLSKDVSAKDVAGTNWFYAYRLTDFTNFKSHQMNEFVTGFTGNNTGVDSASIRIRAKWIKGFFNGRAFDNNLVIEGRIMNSNSSADYFNFDLNNDNAVILSPGMPSETTLDLAFEATENGKLISFYYRINSDQSELTKESGGWQLARSCDLGDIDPEAILYGYPVNKGVMSLMISSLAFPVTIPQVSINTGLEVNIMSQDDPEIVTSQDLEEEYGLQDFIPIAPKQGVTVNVDDNSMVALRYIFGGLDTKISSLNLQKLKDDGSYLTFSNYLTNLKAVDGGWTLASLEQPETPLPASSYLNNDERYYLYLVVKDNGEYDLDLDPGVIRDPTVLGSDITPTDDGGSTGAGGGSGGGCNITAFPMISVLLLAPLFVLFKK